MRIVTTLKSKILNLSVQTRASLVYMMASVLTKGVNILTLPIFTRMLSTEDMGVVTGFNAWYSILYPIVTLSLATASLSVAMIDYKDCREKYQSICLGISSFSSLIFLIIFVIFSKPLVSFTGMDRILFITQLFLFLFNPALDSWFIKQRFEYKYKSVLAVSASIMILSVLVSIGAIYLSRTHGWASLGIARIVGQNSVVVLFALVLWILIFYRGKCIFEKSIAIYALKLSIPLIIHTLAKNILDASDRLMITRLCGDSDAGIYGTVYNISLMATIIWSAVNSAIVPEMFIDLESRKYEHIKKTTVRVLLIMACATVFSTIIAPEILRILTTKEYYSAVTIMPAIMIGVFFTAVYGLYGNVLMFYKRSELVMLATIGAAAINIVANYIFIKLFGYQAAAYTTFSSFIILAIFEMIMQHRVISEDIIPIRLLLVLSFAVVTVCLLMIMLYSFFWVRIVIIILCIAIAVGFRGKITGIIKGC